MSSVTLCITRQQKGLPVKEGLLIFYAVTHITLQTFHQECFFVRFVCFLIIMVSKNRD